MSTLRRRLTGLLAALTILGIVAGLPLLLVAIDATPWPEHLPTLSDITTTLTTVDDGRLFLGLVSVLAWAAWAFMALSLLVEMVSRLRGLRAPRLPGLSLPQAASTRLVSTALLLIVTGTATTGTATAAPAATPAAAPAAVVTQVVATHSVSTHHAAGQRTASTERPTHLVRPGESLWSIADDHLGDGNRWPEIAALNRRLLDGNPSLLRTGWTLTLPTTTPSKAAATPAEMVVVQRGDTLSQLAADHLGNPDRWPEIVTASRHIQQPGGAVLTDPDVIDVGWTLQIPGSTPAAEPPPRKKATVDTPTTPTPAAAPRSPASVRPTPSAAAPIPTAAPTPAAAQPTPATTSSAWEDSLDEAPAWRARTGLGLGALLAAGLVTLLAARRRDQNRRRRPGQSIPTPPPEAADVDQQLQQVADQLSAHSIDAALRDLARTCARTDTALPALRAARLTAAGFDLFLAEPARLPAPWNEVAQGTVWTLPADQIRPMSAAAEQLHDIPAPYPALVTVGHDDEDGHILIDLEYIAALGITGAADTVDEILTALAVELATSPWADDLQVTLIGLHPELEDALATGRIRYLPTVERILDDLTDRVPRDRAALAAAAVDLPTARATGQAPDAWAPEILIIAGELTADQRTRLEDLLGDLPRVAIAAVTSGTAVGEWSLQVSSDPQQATLIPIGLPIRPQRLPAAQYAQLLQVAVLTDPAEIHGTPAPEPTLAEIDQITPATEPDTSPSATTEEQHTDLDAAGVPAATAQHSASPAGDSASDVSHTDTPTNAAAELEVTRRGQIAEDQPLAMAPRDEDQDQPGQGEEEPTVGPRILMLGPVDFARPRGAVEPTKRARLLEYAAFLVTHPGATFSAIDDAIWPDRTREDNLNTRNTATSKLRRWVGTDLEGNDYLPRHQSGGGYGFTSDVTSDLADWDQLINGNAFTAPTENLETALGLLRGAPLQGTHPRRYAWAEPLRQRLIGEIVDASYELARRRLMEGRWRAAEQAAVTGLSVGPAQESLWRLRLLAARESRNKPALDEAVDRLLAATEQYGELEPETETLLAALNDPTADFDQLLTTASL